MGEPTDPHPGAAPNPEPGRPTNVWELLGPPVNAEFVARLVKAAEKGGAEGGLIGSGKFKLEDGKRFSVNLRMGTDNADGPRISDKKQHFEADLVVDGIGNPIDWDLRELGARAKQVDIGYFDEETSGQAKDWAGRKIEQIIITQFRKYGVELCLTKSPDNDHGINLEYREYPSPTGTESHGFYDISTQGAIEATNKVRSIAPAALQAIFSLAETNIAEGRISTHHYRSFQETMEQLDELKKADDTVKIILTSTGDWVVAGPEMVRKESRSDTGREGLDSIFGQVVAARKFRRIIDAMKDPRYRELDAMPNLGILLYGPPGTGKTSIGKAAAAELEANIFILDSREVQTSFIGEAGKSITSRLTSVLAYVNESPERRAVLLIDEIDALAPTVSSGRSAGASLERAREQTTAFKNLLEQIVENGRVLVIGTTNLREDVDSAIRSRLGEEIPMFPPDDGTAARYTQTLIETKAGGVPETSRPRVDVDYPTVAQALVKAGFVQRDIRKIVMEAWAEAAHMHLAENEEFRVTTEEILKMIKDWSRGDEMEARQKKGKFGFSVP